jgi:hypothetical protein
LQLCQPLLGITNKFLLLPETFQHPLSPEIAARKTKRKNRQRQATQVLQEENHQNVLKFLKKVPSLKLIRISNTFIILF